MEFECRPSVKQRDWRKICVTLFVFFCISRLLFVLNASGLLYSPGWPGPHSVAKGDFEVRVVSPASVP